MAQKLTYEKVLEMFAETDKRFKETDERLKKTEELIKENAKNIGGISDSNGKFAEEQYINALKAFPSFSPEIFSASSFKSPLFRYFKCIFNDLLYFELVCVEM